MGILGGGATMPEYKPYSTESGVGSVAVKGDQITATLDPRYRALVDQLTGGFQVTPSLSQEQLGLGRQATEAGAGFLKQLGSFDPFAAAETQFGRMEEILSAGRARDRSSLEGKLLRQGRLGSTGGGVEQEALEGAIEQSRRQGLVEALGQAQGIQAQQAQLGTQLGAFGGTIEQQQLQRMLESLGSAMSVEQLPIMAGQLGATLSGQRSQHQQAKAEFDAANAGAGWGDILAGGLTAAGTAFGGPLGGMAAKGLSSYLTPKSEFDLTSLAY